MCCTADRPRGSSTSRRRKRAGIFSENYALPARARRARPPRWLKLEGVTRNNLDKLDVRFRSACSPPSPASRARENPVSSVRRSSSSSRTQLGHELPRKTEEGEELERAAPITLGGRITAGMEHIKRLVRVDQKPIGRTPRSNLATYTGLFDHVRRLFAATKAAKARHYDAGRFSFNVAKGRCETCEGEGFVMVELLFLPSVYAPCPTCHGARYNAKTLEIQYRGKNIAEVLGMTVDSAWSILRGRAAARALARRRARGRARLPAARAARDGALGRRSAAHQARDRAAARSSAAIRCMCSMSRPPACTRRMWRS